MKESKIRLDTVLFQKDRRIRLPKQIIDSLEAVPGETNFEIYLDPFTDEIILRKCIEDKKITGGK